MTPKKELDFIVPESLIITPSGMRGIWGENLAPATILRFSEAFGTWLKKLQGKPNPRVLIGMDTRTTGPALKHACIAGLMSVGCEILDADVSPTPFLMHGHCEHECDGTVILSASHNPPKYNGMKCLAPSGTFLSNSELDEINYWFIENPIPYPSWVQMGSIKPVTLKPSYFTHMKTFLDWDFVQKANEKKPLKVIFDPGAGAGTHVTDEFLREAGCDVYSINETLVDEKFPRSFEPIIEHLGELAEVLEKKQADVGFAHDCDADRIALIDEQGRVLPEDIILAIIVNHILKTSAAKYEKITLVTNVASTLVLEKLAESYAAKVLRTPVGERYLACAMTDLISQDSEGHLIFGGEGSCGGVMLPEFNNARDGIFAALKIVEIMLKTQKSISELREELPTFYSVRKKVPLPSPDVESLMQALKDSLHGKGITFEEVDRDIRVSLTDEWVLIHPSNTEPIIRIITESSSAARSEELLEIYAQYLSEVL